jgi:hypothetical protein
MHFRDPLQAGSSAFSVAPARARQYGLSVRLGMGGGAFGVRGGISTRGVGVGVGPFSAGTSWRGGGSGGGGGGLLAWLIAGAIFFFIAAWPYLLGTFIAVRCGAFNPSTERFLVGWCFEVVYIAGLVAWFMTAREKGAQRAAEEAQRMAELTASGAVYEAKQGRSVVYRHGTCTVNHKSPETAASCRKPASSPIGELQDASPVSDSPLTGRRSASRSAAVWAAAILGVGLVIGLVILLIDPIHSPAEEASSKPCPAQTSNGGTAATITVPDLVGQNAGGVEDQLKSLGLNSVELSSANTGYKSVWVASNWTVVSTDPAAGCLVNRYDRVVVYVTK